jgi:hypothetical protein
MSTDCKIEFYFRREELQKLLEKNPDAKGIIISQAIVREKPKGAENYVNVVRIKARVDPGSAPTAMKLMATDGSGDSGDDSGDDNISGCPYPPGCTV